jgi:maltooligosyltrehalose synthase
MLYQTLLGAWPPDLADDDRDGVAELRERVAGWMRKALREAKRHSSWDAPAQAYEDGCAAFLANLLDDAAFIEALHRQVQRIAPSAAAKGLAQALLRMTVPGVPDLYQGCEFWDHSLVDPDNRRPVDHGARQHALADDAPLEALLAQWRDGRIKQRLVARALEARRRQPRLFARGDYLPLVPNGPAAGDVVVFARTHGAAQALVVAAVHPPVATTAGGLRLPTETFAGTVVQLPPALQGEWHDAVAGGTVRLTKTPALGVLAHGIPARLLLRH